MRKRLQFQPPRQSLLQIDICQYPAAIGESILRAGFRLTGQDFISGDKTNFAFSQPAAGGGGVNRIVAGNGIIGNHDTLASLLSADERARLARLQSRDDQLRFLAVRGLPVGYLGAAGCLHLADFLTTPDKECS